MNAESAAGVIVVTGASSGIGAALARRLAGDGRTVALVARRAERLEEVLRDCLAGAPGSRSWPADLSDPDAAAALVERIWEEQGPIDVLVNNAGRPMRRHVTRLDMGDVRRTMDINYFSPVAMALALLPRMQQRGHGVIVNVSSLGGRLGIPTEAAYCASKFALAGWSESAAADLGRSAVKVRLVLPGAIDTEIWDQPDSDPPVMDVDKVPPEEIVDGLVEAIDGDRFEHYLPDMKGVVEMKTSDFDGFLAGMVAMSEGAATDAANQGSSEGSSEGSTEGSSEGSSEGSTEGSIEGAATDAASEGSNEGSSQGGTR